MSLGPEDGAALASALADVLGEALGERPEITDLERLTGGASRSTWAFRATVGGDVHRLVLQRDRPGGLGAGGMVTEASLLRLAADGGVPVAPVVASGRAGGPLGGSWLVTRWVDGESIPRRVLTGPALAAARHDLARRAGEVLGAVHALAPDAVDGLERFDALERFATALDALGEPHPVLELGVRRLRATRPAARPSVVVHGDFRLGNLVVAPDGLAAVVDWELAHLGEPGEDLGWFCCRAWRFGEPAEAGGVGTVEDLRDGYAAASGTVVPVDEIRWWQALGTLAWGVMCIVQAQTHTSGRHRSVELAAIGRRTAQTEEDLLELLFGPSDIEPAGPVVQVGGNVGPHDPPSAVDLLGAVSEYLRTDVMVSAAGRTAFGARVAANVVDMVAREIVFAPGQAVASAARYRRLGVDGQAELAALLRRGELDDRLDEIAAELRGAVRDKLAVSHPGYWHGDGGAR